MQFPVFSTSSTPSFFFFHIIASPLILSPLVAAEEAAYYDYNINCAPYELVVQTDVTGKFRWIPYYVKLHRCRGKDWQTDNPLGIKCAPTKVTKVDFLVDGGGTSGTIKLDNHTQCEPKCKYKTGTCAKDQQWNTDICSCCPKAAQKMCARGKVWNETLCMCVCPSAGGCEKIDPSPPPAPTFLNVRVKVKYVWFITIAEGVLLVTLCLLGFHYHCRRQRHQGKCCSGCRGCQGSTQSEKCEIKSNMNGIDEKNGNEFSERERFLSF